MTDAVTPVVRPEGCEPHERSQRDDCEGGRSRNLPVGYLQRHGDPSRQPKRILGEQAEERRRLARTLLALNGQLFVGLDAPVEVRRPLFNVRDPPSPTQSSQRVHHERHRDRAERDGQQEAGPAHKLGRKCLAGADQNRHQGHT